MHLSSTSHHDIQFKSKYAKNKFFRTTKREKPRNPKCEKMQKDLHWCVVKNWELKDSERDRGKGGNLLRIAPRHASELNLTP